MVILKFNHSYVNQYLAVFQVSIYESKTAMNIKKKIEWVAKNNGN